ncbi:hypothetical protein BHE17_08730 [Planococcus maritimus]|nr:hypothetical protein BHE17_08730 [Planococcus maritimus]
MLGGGAAGVHVILKFLIFLMGDEIMMAMLIAQRVILKKMILMEVPAMLQPKVKVILLDSGMRFVLWQSSRILPLFVE